MQSVNWSNDKSGICVRAKYSHLVFLFRQHFVLRRLAPPPLTVTNLLTWLIVEIATWGMFDKTNCLIVAFTPMFSYALDGLERIHSYDLYNLIVCQIVESFFSFPFDVKVPSQMPVMWDCRRCNVPTIYRQYIGQVPFDYIHQRRLPTGKLAMFLALFTPAKSYKRGLKLLRMYRVLTDYCYKNQLASSKSYMQSIFISDRTLFQIFGVDSFHSMDLPYLLLHHSRPFERRTQIGADRHVC